MNRREALKRMALLGGKFEIFSRPNRGTHVLVELPIATGHKKGTVGKATESV